MTAESRAPGRVLRLRFPRRLREIGTTFHAVLTRELRWRMRGRRAYLVATVAVLLMGAFVFALHQLQLGRAMVGTPGGTGLAVEELSGAASVRIGRAIFAGLLGLLTFITLVVAPALASGAISTEREKGTMELLVTVPMSTLGMVMGKLVAALAYVLLLIAASLPLMFMAFAFGGIGVEDILAAYALVLALAFGTGALGLYLSALLGRTQVAALTCYLILLALTGTTLGAHAWLGGSLDVDRRLVDGCGECGTTGDGDEDVTAAERRERREQRRLERAERRRLGQIALVFNPVAAGLDVVCTAMPGVDDACSIRFAAGPVSLRMEDSQGSSLWPRASLGWVVVGGTLMLLATQHISPSRRLGPLRWLGRLRERVRRPM